jgi:hypothetical protein
MEVANTLAYYNTVTITAAKSFIVQAPCFVVGESSSAEKAPILSFCWCPFNNGGKTRVSNIQKILNPRAWARIQKISYDQ